MALQRVEESWANLVPLKAESPWDFSCSQVFIFSDQRFPNIVWVSNESVVEEGLDHTDLLSVLVMILAKLREINERRARVISEVRQKPFCASQSEVGASITLLINRLDFQLRWSNLGRPVEIMVGCDRSS